MHVYQDKSTLKTEAAQRENCKQKARERKIEAGDKKKKSRRDLLARSLLPLPRKLFPNPTLPGQRFGYTNDWLVSNQSRQGTNQWGSKIDHAISDKDRLSGEYIWSLNTIPSSTGRWPGAIGDGSTSHTQQDIARLSQDYIFTPTLVNHWTLGFNRWYSDSVALSGVGWPAQLGWNGVPQTGPGSVFPGLNIGGLGNTYGNGGQGYDATNVFTVDESVTWTKGRHTVKGGFGYIKMQQNDGGYGRQSGYLTFNGGQRRLHARRGLPGNGSGELSARVR